MPQNYGPIKPDILDQLIEATASQNSAPSVRATGLIAAPLQPEDAITSDPVKLDKVTFQAGIDFLNRTTSSI